MINEAIIKLINKENLTEDMAKKVMDEIMSGETDPVLISSYLTALTMKGETVEEITASAKGMRAAGTHLLTDKETFEIVGTGGDGSNSFNISTTASFIIAAAGVPVTKHGNRAASSKSGAADCLEALGVLANGKATKIVVPSDLQGLASLATTFKGIVEEQKVPAGKEVQK